MMTRLRALPWGWILIGLAYSVAVLPIQPQPRLFWLGIVVALAYLVVAVRTTRSTAHLAQEHDTAPILTLWSKSFRTTLLTRAVLFLPMFCLMMAAQQFMVMTPQYCPSLFTAYCMTYGGGIEAESVLLASAFLGLFLLLDHGLLTALTLMVQKHLPKSPAFVGNTAVGLRFALAAATLALVAISLNLLDLTAYSSYDSLARTDPTTYRRVVETIYPGFEPLVNTGLFLSSNVLNHPSYCQQYDNSNPRNCLSEYDTRPFLARQLVSMMMGVLMYGLLIVVALRVAAPLSFRLRLVEKNKHGFTPEEPELDITYL
jgi:hypothetical protein